MIQWILRGNKWLGNQTVVKRKKEKDRKWGELKLGLGRVQGNFRVNYSPRLGLRSLAVSSCMLQMESTQKSRGYVSDILKLLCLLVKYLLEETTLWLCCGGRHLRGRHEVDVQVFQSVTASTLINRSAVEGNWWDLAFDFNACLGGRYLATSTGAPYPVLGGL